MSPRLPWLGPGLVAVVLGGICGGGCAIWPGRDTRPAAVRFEVSISNLDWVEIAYLPEPGDRVFQQPCRLSLMGSGEVLFRTGRSPRVWDSFSSAVDDPHWNEVFDDRRHIGQAAMQTLYQQLVDAGLFLRYTRHLIALEGDGPRIRINAQIGRERTVRLTDDRALVRVVERVLEMFEDTARLAHPRETPR